MLHASHAPLFLSPSVGLLLADVVRAATTPVRMMICGEPGTGHEMLAREIHRRTGSADRPFVKVACSSQPAETFELDLFGCLARHAGGQERRALERFARGSHVHQALGGTIFFANLTKMPLRVQGRVARLLHDGELVLLDEKKRVTLNVHAIAAVEQGYDEPVQDGRISKDLYSLISGIRIDLPPLRGRREDIPALAALLIDESCRRHGVPTKQLSDSARQLLCALPWHGNAAELQRLLGELVHSVRGNVIDLADVLSSIQIDGRVKAFDTGGTLREARARFEREYIAAVLAQHHGRIPQAAKTLGIQRPNLYRKLRRLKVQKTTTKGQSRVAGR
jgi:DNA-binding NtrC family response regulator